MQQADTFLFPKSAGAGAPGADLIDVTLQGFRAEVMEESMRRLVLVDFWAPWCGPCKQLGPVLEKLVKAARGKVRLAKMNIDEWPQIAEKLGIQSIPAVVAFQGGQMVDGFVGVLPESEIKAFIDRCGGSGGPDIEAIYAEAQGLLDAGEAETAEPALMAILEADSAHVGARAGVARVLVARKNFDEARALLDAISVNQSQAAPVVAARAELALAEQAVELGDLAPLLARVEKSSDDHQARYELAMALNAAGQREGAAAELLQLFRRDRAWNDDAAWKLLLQLFESWGPLDPATRSARRQLSTLLFS
jgi:putative thioredoxin